MAILIEKEKVELLTNLSLVYVLFILYNCKKKIPQSSKLQSRLGDRLHQKSYVVQCCLLKHIFLISFSL